jgi:hypothetical protein
MLGAAAHPSGTVEVEQHLQVGELLQAAGRIRVEHGGVQRQLGGDRSPVVLEDRGSSAHDHADRDQLDGLVHHAPLVLT